MKRVTWENYAGLLLLCLTSGSALAETAQRGQYVLSASPDFSAPARAFSAPPIYGKVVFAEGATADTLWGCPKARNGTPTELNVSFQLDGKGLFQRRFTPTPEQCQARELEIPLLPGPGTTHEPADTAKFVEVLLKRGGTGSHELSLRMNAGRNPNIGPFITTSFTLELSDTGAWSAYREKATQAAVSGRRLPAGLKDKALVGEFKSGLKKTSYEKALEVVVTQSWEIIRDVRNQPVRKVLRGVVAYREPGTTKCMMRRADLYREFNGAAYEPAKLVIEGGFLPSEIACP